MNIELRFLQKAIEDKNYISFTYNNEKQLNVMPLELRKEDSEFILKTQKKVFIFSQIKKLKILKERFSKLK